MFETYYHELYDADYYWQAKDAVAMKRLLQKITFGRTNRAQPLPCEDDDLLKALDIFLRMINKAWLMNNFSVNKIDGQYNEIVSEIKTRIIMSQELKRASKPQPLSLLIKQQVSSMTLQKRTNSIIEVSKEAAELRKHAPSVIIGAYDISLQDKAIAAFPTVDRCSEVDSPQLGVLSEPFLLISTSVLGRRYRIWRLSGCKGI